MKQTSHSENSLHWQADWRSSLFTFIFLPSFIALGFWQLERADEKRVLQEMYQQRAEQAPVPLESLRGIADSLAYRRILLRGEFDEERSFLLDNRTHQGRYGFEVLSPFRLSESGRLVLVNRGWVKGDPARRSLPEVPPVPGTLSLVATVYVPPGESLVLSEEPDAQGWPQVVQSLDIPLLADRLDEMLYPYSLRLERASAASLIAEWPLVNMSVDKHKAYATQWFAMALALALFYLAYSTNLASWWRQRRGNSYD